MPRNDRTGPEGFGPYSGRGLGLCSGTRETGSGIGTEPGSERGFEGGMGRRTGIRYWQGFRRGVAGGPGRVSEGFSGRGFGRGSDSGPGFGLRGFSGRGFRRGIGFGFRRPFFSRSDSVPLTDTYDQENLSKDDELSYLTGFVESMEHELKAIRGRLTELTGKGKEQ